MMRFPLRLSRTRWRRGRYVSSLSAVLVAVGLVAVATPSATTLAAVASFAGDGSCPHGNGSYNSSACFLGIVQSGVYAAANLPEPSGFVIGGGGDQMRWRIAEFGGAPGDFVETGAMLEFYRPGCTGALQAAYLPYTGVISGGVQVQAYMNDDGCPGTLWPNPACHWNDQLHFRLADEGGNWDATFTDDNSSACNVSWTWGGLGIDGGAVAEGGTVFVPDFNARYSGTGGSWTDGSSAGPFNIPNVLVTAGGVNRNWNNYVIDNPCGTDPCMNGRWYNNGDGWSSNKEGGTAGPVTSAPARDVNQAGPLATGNMAAIDTTTGLADVTRTEVVHTTWAAVHAADPHQPGPPSAAYDNAPVTLIVQAGAVPWDGLVGQAEPYRYHWESTLITPPVNGNRHGLDFMVTEPGTAWPLWLRHLSGTVRQI
jgi:hypothetical protein